MQVIIEVGLLESEFKSKHHTENTLEFCNMLFQKPKKLKVLRYLSISNTKYIDAECFCKYQSTFCSGFLL